MKAEFDLLVYLSLVLVVLVIGIAAVVIARIPEQVDLETRKVRFAAATFTGILMLFVFSASLYFADRGTGASAGKEVFEKGLSAMFTLAGTIVGYLFGVTRSSRPSGGAAGDPGA
jgi:hypothetical protein